jgi:hypothetical protein
VVDAFPLRLMIGAMLGWLDRRQQDTVAYLKNVGHRVGRSTIARMLKAHGVAPVPDRPTSWQTFLRALWGAAQGAWPALLRAVPCLARMCS